MGVPATSVDVPIIFELGLAIAIVHPVTINDSGIFLTPLGMASIVQLALTRTVSTVIASARVKSVGMKGSSRSFVPPKE